MFPDRFLGINLFMPAISIGSYDQTRSCPIEPGMLTFRGNS